MRNYEFHVPEVESLELAQFAEEQIMKEFNSRIERAIMTGTVVFLTDNHPTRAGIMVGPEGGRKPLAAGESLRVYLINRILEERGYNPDPYRVKLGKTVWDYAAYHKTDDPNLQIVVKRNEITTAKSYPPVITEIHALGVKPKPGIMERLKSFKQSR